MADVTKHVPGTFCWADLATTDADGARAFYTQLFGWQAFDVPAGEGAVYTMLQKDGKNVCGLYAMDNEMRAGGMPSFWQSYAAVENVDESAEKATQLEGTIAMPPFDVMDAGRMAVVQDPTGAALALWQQKSIMGTTVVNEPGSVCWHELYTKDTQAASKFYMQLFDWTMNKMSGAMGQDYFEFKRADVSVGGMLEIQPEWGEVPPNWAIYFAIDDLAATLEKAANLGGAVVVPPMEVENVGQFATIRDPHDGHFCVIQMREGLM